MKAMILAAGFGTRLRPLTDNRPKALLPVNNRAIIDHVLMYLKGFGVSDVIINAHHHQAQLVDHINRGKSFDLNVEVRVEQKILGTGGGVKNTQDFWDPEPFILINGDILTNIDLAEAYDAHAKGGGLVTMVVHEYKPFSQIQINNRLDIVDIARKNLPNRLAFACIHIVDPELLDYLPESEFLDIIDCYRRLIRSGKKIKAHITKGHYWRDIGMIDSYIQANREALQDNSFVKGPGCRLHRTARLTEWAVMGPRVRVEAGVEISRSILWEDVWVKKGVTVSNSIVTAGKEVASDLINEIC